MITKERKKEILDICWKHFVVDGNPASGSQGDISYGNCALGVVIQKTEESFPAHYVTAMDRVGRIGQMLEPIPSEGVEKASRIHDIDPMDLISTIQTALAGKKVTQPFGSPDMDFLANLQDLHDNNCKNPDFKQIFAGDILHLYATYHITPPV